MIWNIFIGLIIGAVAKFLMPGKDPGGIIITILLGILGSVFAGWLGVQVGFYQEGEPVGFIASVGGAMMLLLIARMIRNNK